MRAMKQDLLSLHVVVKTLLLLLVVAALGVAGAAGISLLSQDNPAPLPMASEPDYLPKPRDTLNEPALKPIAEDFTGNEQQTAVLGETDSTTTEQDNDNLNAPKPAITPPNPRSHLRSLTDTLNNSVDAVTGLITNLL